MGWLSTACDPISFYGELRIRQSKFWQNHDMFHAWGGGHLDILVHKLEQNKKKKKKERKKERKM